ncbi:histidine phosphatase family protein [Candidatus Pacebacteria bacterium]|nr:histidine phosphatase family protein [Candidatus Paceibacterota bacterium]
MKTIITTFAHGTTTDNENGISTGWNDALLSEMGIQQAQDLRGLIKNKHFDVVYHSDLIRAVNTARLALGERDIPFYADKSLRECNYGDLNGGPVITVEPMYDECIEVPFPEGESLKDVEARIADFLEKIKVKHPNQSVAIVSHKAPQLAIEVLIHEKTWEEAIATDWRKTKS